ncbi:Crp/Fnr family transcriptional regulator [Kordiimonas marina]|uniref:Crp/Fnr family transcriptional regulator n=1 Tax=Kordiimonas marina TaxID=2872312 RepID=UPI001FF664C9|nr:Crp/Fnr family transcriptional regulator [Kordiimonas marina]MCJ9427743.1 Crp/Fnr family transcriptional regulator [Kordiimonas marina]
MQTVAKPQERQTAYSLLARHALFAGIDDQTVEMFAQAGQLQEHTKGNILFLQDDEAEWFYVVVSGWVKLFRETMDGHEAVIDILTYGQSFGETAILENGQHSFGAMVVEKSTLLRLPAAMLKRSVTENNRMALAMLHTLSDHRRRQTREIESLTLQNASQRIGCFLLRLCHIDMPQPIELKLPYDKSLIAARLGMKSETFSRALNKLRDETNIKVEGSNVIIPNLDTMSRFACSACSNEFPCEDTHHSH